jgi:hypothetical protein
MELDGFSACARLGSKRMQTELFGEESWTKNLDRHCMVCVCVCVYEHRWNSELWTWC